MHDPPRVATPHAVEAQRRVKPPLVPAGPGNTMQDLLEMDHPMAGPSAMVSGFLIHGLNLMERGYIFTCMVLAAISASLIDRRFGVAGVWALVGAAFAALGLTHAYQLSGNTVDYLLVFTKPTPGAFVYRAPSIVIGYGLIALTCFAYGRASRRRARPASGHMRAGD